MKLFHRGKHNFKVSIPYKNNLSGFTKSTNDELLNSIITIHSFFPVYLLAFLVTVPSAWRSMLLLLSRISCTALNISREMIDG